MALVLLLLVFTVSTVAANEDAFVGVNIRTNVSNMPQPTQVAALLKAKQIHHVRLYNADPKMLLALANTGITVAISVPNDQILGISQSNSTAANWVTHNILPHYPATNITTVCVGSNVLTTLPNIAPSLINALKNIHSSLKSSNLEKQIKVSTPLASSVILESFPPSNAFFNQSWKPVLVPLLQFLQSTGSHFMINLNPYHDYVHSNDLVTLDYALFKPTDKQPLDTNTGLHYTNAFGSMVDAAYFAMANLNITNVLVLVTESGWPSKGNVRNPDANPDNAKTYNTNLIKHVLNRTGTPKHPGIAVTTYIYELYNEDTNPEALSWGLFETSGVAIYDLEFTSQGLANGTANETHCTVKQGMDSKVVQAALDWACGPGKVDCSPLMQGKLCYEPDTLFAHATYAFDAYYHLMGKAPGSCDFNGVAVVTSISPSNGSCTFSGSDKKGSRVNSSSTTPAMDSQSSYSSAIANVFQAANIVIGVLGFVAFLF